MRKRVKVTRRRPVDEAEVIVIPMIDVMMFLLFFFVVASLALVVQAGLPVNLPKAATADKHRAIEVTITIQANRAVYLNRTPTSMAVLAAGLRALHLPKDNVVILNADASVPHGLVVTAMDEARKAGVTRFAIATDRG